ncbi:MAG: hypothetical protein QY332_07300 [Anaerolineales bacterium]|nr:MAG: hypothetical protein QY332_07300 [Anaerolineales bacterium]
MEELRTEMQSITNAALSLKRRVKEEYRVKGIKIDSRGMLNLLESITEDLSKEKISKKRLESHAFGIFRIITDGWIFEKTEVGQDLMKFRLELRKFASRLQDINKPEN